MPEPDFRRAIHESLRAAPPDFCEQRVTGICQSRGATWRYSLGAGFEWTGDSLVEGTVVAPALSAVEDPRFAGGVKSEFDSARAELALGTPTALRQSVHQSACAVESAIKVVLGERGVSFDATANANPLFDLLVDEGILERHMHWTVLAAVAIRNRRGGHGAGVNPHDVTQAEAEAAFASACVAIAYLRTLLP